MVNAPATAAFAASSNSSFRVCRQLAHGAIRRDLPARFGGWKTAHRRLRCWCESGVIAQVFRHLAEDQAVGRSRGGLTTKTHAIVNARGKVMALSLMPEQRADITEAESLLDEVGPAAFIPSKRDRRYSRKIIFRFYKNRNIIERFSARLKQFRGTATRYDRLKSTVHAAVQLVSVIIGIN